MNLLENPFFTLKANTKDNRSKLLELEDEILKLVDQERLIVKILTHAMVHVL